MVACRTAEKVAALQEKDPGIHISRMFLLMKSGVQSPVSKVRSPESRIKAAEGPDELLNFPQIPGTHRVAQRISAKDAMENLGVMEQLQRWLSTNVQEALALEVGLLKLRL